MAANTKRRHYPLSCYINGPANVTIRFLNGTPKIVNVAEI